MNKTEIDPFERYWSVLDKDVKENVDKKALGDAFEAGRLFEAWNEYNNGGLALNVKPLNKGKEFFEVDNTYREDW
jgi:hypothetical protein